MNLRLGILAAIFAAALAPTLAATPPPKVADPNDPTPAACTEGMCPVCAKVGTLATIRACTAIIDNDAAKWDGRAAAYWERSSAHELRGEYTQAIGDLTAEINLARPHYHQTSVSLDGAYLHRAVAYYKARRFAETIDDIEKIEPQMDMLDLRAKAFWHLGKYQQALDDANTLIPPGGFKPFDWYVDGLVRSFARNYSVAIDEFTKAADLLRVNIPKYHDPHDTQLLAKVLYERSLARRQSGDVAAADQDLAEAKATDPEFADAVQTPPGDPEDPHNWYLRGLIRSSITDYAGAIADFSKAIEFARKDFQSYGDASDSQLLARALYQRSLARRQSGDATGADADLAGAKAANAHFDDPDDVR